MLTKESIEQIETINAISLRCVKTFHFFELTTTPGGQFWNLVQNVMGENCCLLWGHLFGKKSDDLHYTQFFARPDVESTGSMFKADQIKKRILSKIAMDDYTYSTFWQTMNSIRDKYIAHRDLDKIPLVFPDIKICSQMVSELRNILSELVLAHLNAYPGNPELTLLHEYFNEHPSSELETDCKEEFYDGIEFLLDVYRPT